MALCFSWRAAQLIAEGPELGQERDGTDLGHRENLCKTAAFDSPPSPSDQGGGESSSQHAPQMVGASSRMRQAVGGG